MHDLTYYGREGLSFYKGFLLTFVTGFTSLNVLLLFSLPITLSLCSIFDVVSSNVEEFLSINPSTNVFFFGDFNVHNKDWLTYSGETSTPGELKRPYSDCYLYASICYTVAFPPLGNDDHVIVSVSID